MTDHAGECFAWIVTSAGHRCAECGQLEAADAIDSLIVASERGAKVRVARESLGRSQRG